MLRSEPTRWVPEMPASSVLAWPGGGYLRRDLSEEQLRRVMAHIEDNVLETRIYRGPRDLAVIATLDDTTRFGVLLHVSLSYGRKDPSWREIRWLRSIFFPPDVDVMMMLPAEADYVSIHEHAFHLIQTPERWGMR